MTGHIIQPQKPYNILLLGDNCTDEYQFGTVERISPEAPVPVFKLARTETRPGMAGNVAENLRALGCKVFGYYGTTSHKIRIVDIKSKQHLIRIDHDVVSEPIILQHKPLQDIDAIVVSDYCKGAIELNIIHQLREQHLNIPIFVDTKKPMLHEFAGCFVKINQLELEQARTLTDHMIITQGEQGAIYKGVTYSGVPVEVADVTGAGDTFLSALTVGYLSSGVIPTAIQFAIRASAITVQHFGCYAPTQEEICG